MEYKINCWFDVYGEYNIEADSLEEALEKMENISLPIKRTDVADYVEVDYEGIELNNNLNEIDKTFLNKNKL
mgnify:CR=1 FL=1